MRIAHLTAGLSRESGGPSVSIRRLAQSLLSQHGDVEVLGIGNRHQDDDLAVWKPLEPIVAIRRFPISIGYAPGLQPILEKLGPDLVHAHGLWMYPSMVALRWAQKTGRPHIVSPRGMLEPWAWRHHWWKKRPIWWAWEERHVESAAVLHATADEEADNLRTLGLMNPIAVIPNGVDLPELHRRDGRDGIRTALFLSRIHPKKGLLNLVRAWAVLKPSGWRVVVAGPDQGGHESKVKAAVREAQLEDQFEFLGPLYEEAKWQLYREADLFVLPTFSENFGIAIAEALAAGLPVITTRGAPWRELETCRCGWWIDTGVEPLTMALKRATQLSDVERAEMGLRGRRLMEEKYSWPGIAGEMMDVYKWVLGQGPKPACVRLV